MNSGHAKYTEKKPLAVGAPSSNSARYSSQPIMKKVQRMARYCRYGATGALNGRVFGSMPCTLRARRKPMWVTRIVSQLMKVAIETYKNTQEIGQQSYLSLRGMAQSMTDQ